MIKTATKLGLANKRGIGVWCYMCKINLLQVTSLQKSKNFSAEKHRRHRDSPKKISATLGDFGDVRRINIFLFGCARWVPARPGWGINRSII
jgi:hypothetical protein